MYIIEFNHFQYVSRRRNDDCKGHFRDHKNETGQEEITVKCAELKDIYSFVERDNQSNSTEVLRINDTIIHTIIYDWLFYYKSTTNRFFNKNNFCAFIIEINYEQDKNCLIKINV